MIKIELGDTKDNGVYGTPMNIISLENNIGLKCLEDKWFLMSAIFVAISTWYKDSKIKIMLNSPEYILFEVLTDNYTGLNNIYYKDVEVIDKVYWLFSKIMWVE